MILLMGQFRMDEAVKKGCKYTRVPWLKEVPEETSPVDVQAAAFAVDEGRTEPKLLAMISSFEDNGSLRLSGKTQDVEALHERR